MEYAIWVPLATICALIILSAIFSGSETALTAVSKARIHQMKTKGNKRAALVSKLREDKESLIGALLLGNNAVNIMASAIATNFAIHFFGEHGVAVATITMTALVLIFAEVLPKSYAINHAEPVALKISPLIMLLVKVLSPITNTVQHTVNAILKLLGLRKRKQNFSAVDELRGAIELHHHEGSMIKRDRDMLGSILDLAETEVSEIMIHRKNMVTVNIELPPTELFEAILAANHTRVPLWQGQQDNIVGVVHVKKLLEMLRIHKGNFDQIDVQELMSEPWFVPETNLLSNQLTLFRKMRSHFALVVDEYGDLVGLLTLEDILEEIVGKIDDEYDPVAEGIKKLRDGSIRANGDITIRDLNRLMDWNLPDDDATTLAGLVIHEAETIPDIGEQFRWFGYHFSILKKRKNQITSIQVKRETSE